MEDVLSIREQDNIRRGQIAAGLAFLMIIIGLFLIRFYYQNPPPGQEGIQVNLGIPDIGMGEDLNAPIAQNTPQENDPVEEVVPEEQQEEVTPTEPVTTPNPDPPVRDVVTTEDPAQVAIRKQQEREQREQREQQERERQERERQERERQEQERREAAQRAREQAAQDMKDEMGGLFNNGGGGGNTNTAGDGGAENGDPNNSNIGKQSFGSGTVGGGLGSRGVTSSPTLRENSQETGTVVVSLCVGSNGRVDPSSVKVTQRGTNTSSAQLRAAAVRNAKAWGFSAGGPDRQCGSITYNFKVQ